jgi:anti-sigma factor RsiW
MSMKRIAGFFSHLFHPCSCGRTKKLLYEFVEGDLNPETSRKLEKHIGDCPPCLEYVKSYRRTIELTHCHCLPEKPMPDALKQKLHEFIEQNPDLK